MSRPSSPCITAACSAWPLLPPSWASSVGLRPPRELADDDEDAEVDPRPAPPRPADVPDPYPWMALGSNRLSWLG